MNTAPNQSQQSINKISEYMSSSSNPQNSQSSTKQKINNTESSNKSLGIHSNNKATKKQRNRCVAKIQSVIENNQKICGHKINPIKMSNLIERKCLNTSQTKDEYQQSIVKTIRNIETNTQLQKPFKDIDFINESDLLSKGKKRKLEPSNNYQKESKLRRLNK
eukprot:gb/GECH01003896.1/.p1 GENE.gb/GECH01003896.1/~~gb/GECH01003896.1/.p1  ORF type:complete len:163 (+),score=47.94 gb/GECH01003896.1/:1-489(+)